MRNVCKWNNFIYFENMKKINRKFLKIKKWFSEKKNYINIDQLGSIMPKNNYIWLSSPVQAQCISVPKG
jgi:hypothetical protein